jgi:ribonuclease HII
MPPRRNADPFLPLDEPEIPTDFFERRARKRGARRIAGVDEVGRGPLAGPVVVAAVMFDGRKFPRGLNDSKLLSREERVRLYDKIMARAIVSVAIASRERIDRMNILQASLWAMTKAVRALAKPADHVLVDGNIRPPGLPCECEALVGGDGRSVSIAAASIVAKVTRDRLMSRLALAYPGYGFEQHMGYSTPQHFAALDEHGPCPHHRRSFMPVRQKLQLQQEDEVGPVLFGPDELASAAASSPR